MIFLACNQGSVLDKQDVLERQPWWDNRDWKWYEEKIPFFESPDPDIDATYYYRWEILTKHLTYGSPETGYTFTEFIDRPFWSGTYGAISCPLGHQFYEIRWLKDRQVIDDFARYWFETPGAEPRSYSNWYGDAMWATYMVLGDPSFIEQALPWMESQYQGWLGERWDTDHEMFRWDGMHDGMETNINSRQTADSFMGAEGYRPTLNSYMYADALAISRAARLTGDSAKANEFEQRALSLRERVQDELWDPGRQFFFHQFAYDESSGVEAKSLTYQTGPYAGNEHGRELIGYVPWQFNLPEPGYESAWQFLMDEAYFAAPFGPTTVEQNDPLFLTTDICCVWSGNSWPYATTQTLTAFANLLNNYEQSFVTREDYFRLLKTYTLTQRKDGRPYIAEAADPYTGSWAGHDTYYHSEHYLHSAYVDLIITGLVGLRPRADDTLEINPMVPDDWDYFSLEDVAYKGRLVTILWDRDGSRYGGKAGLTAYVDGRPVANSSTARRITVPIQKQEVLQVSDKLVNLAVNNDGKYFPVISASYAAPESPPLFANDGHYWYHSSPPNRWTAQESPNASDWLAMNFGAERSVETAKVYLLDDGGQIRPPSSYEVEYWTGTTWEDVPSQHREPEVPTGRMANVVAFTPVVTTQLRVVFSHAPGTKTGVSEVEVWGREQSPLTTPTETIRNLALNAVGSGAPKISASYEATNGPAGQVNDGRVAFTRYSRNRWSTSNSPNARDYVQMDFDRPRTVGTIDVYLFADEERGLSAPGKVTIQTRQDGVWVEATVREITPATPMGSARNRFVIRTVDTDGLRVVLTHRPRFRSAISELQVWPP